MRNLNNIFKDKSEELGFDLYMNSIFLGYTGSVAYELYKENDKSDKDVIAVVIPPIDYYLGLKTFPHHGTIQVQQNGWDVTFYDIKKFVSLLVKNNPSVLSLLWTPQKHIITSNSYWNRLTESRNLFKSYELVKCILGFTNGHVKRIEAKGTESEYDFKDAMQLIRWLYMGIDYLETGELEVEAKKKDLLLQIKRGKLTKIKVLTLAYNLTQQLCGMRVYDIQEKPDVNKINDLLVNLLKDYYKAQL
jgi:predicted nucleotidyltransferase